MASTKVNLAAIWVIVCSVLVLSPGAYYPFTLAKLLALTIGVGIAVWARPHGKLPRALLAVMAAGAFWLAVCAATGAAPLSQLIGRWPRYEGLAAAVPYVGALWAGAALLGPGRARGTRGHDGLTQGGSTARRRYEALWHALAIMSLLLALVSVMELAGWRPTGQAGSRPGALLGNATDQGVVAAIGAAVLALPAIRRRQPLWIAGVLGALATVAISASRAAIIGVVLSAIALTVLCFVVPSLRRGLGAVGRWLPLAGAVAGFALTLAVPLGRNRLLGVDNLAASTVSGRAHLWSASLRLFRDHLFLGVGPSGYVDALPQYLTRSYVLGADPSGVADSPHNLLLQLSSAGGVPLLLLGLACAAILAWRCVRWVRGRRAAQDGPLSGTDDDARDLLLAGALAALLSWAAAMLTYFTTVGTVALAALLAGAFLAEPLAPPAAGLAATAARRWRAVRVAATALLAVWALAFAAGIGAEYQLARAIDAAGAGEWAGADQHFASAQALRPWDRSIALQAAHALSAGAAQQDPDAIEPTRRWVRTALRDNPGSIDVLKSETLLYLGSGAWSQASSAASEGLSRSAYDPELHLYRGLALANQGEMEGAVRDTIEATENVYTAADAWSSLADYYDAMPGREADANAARVKAELAAMQLGDISVR